MKALMPIIEQALINGIVSKKAPFTHKSKFGLGLMALSGLLLCATLTFLMIAGYGWLTLQFTQPVAALISAAFILGFSIICALIGILLTKNKPVQTAQSDEIMEMVSAISETLGEDLVEPIRENPKTALLLASAAGFVAGERLN